MIDEEQPMTTGQKRFWTVVVIVVIAFVFWIVVTGRFW